jgi:hypothetical protein
MWGLAAALQAPCKSLEGGRETSSLRSWRYGAFTVCAGGFGDVGGSGSWVGSAVGAPCSAPCNATRRPCQEAPARCSDTAHHRGTALSHEPDEGLSSRSNIHPPKSIITCGLQTHSDGSVYATDAAVRPGRDIRGRRRHSRPSQVRREAGTVAIRQTHHPHQPADKADRLNRRIQPQGFRWSAATPRWHSQTVTTTAARADTSADPARHKGSEPNSTAAGGGLRDTLKAMPSAVSAVSATSAV